MKVLIIHVENCRKNCCCAWLFRWSVLYSADQKAKVLKIDWAGCVWSKVIFLALFLTPEM